MKRGFLNTDKARQKPVAGTDITPVPQDKGKAKAVTPLHDNGPMKRGFLNTDKAKQQLAALAPDPSTTLKDKGKARAITTLYDDEPHPHPPLLDLHCVPPSPTGKKGTLNKKRFIFRRWPRDPNGKPILPSDIHGKEASNGLEFWGATIFDFYFVHRLPDVVNALTISTGSKLARVMKSLGELEHAKEEISWAAREADPEEIPAWDPAEAVVAHERRVYALFAIDHSGMLVPQISPAEPDADVQMLHASDQPAHSTVSTEDAAEVVGIATEDGMSEITDVSVNSTVLPTPQPQLNVSMESPFHPAHYPSPWPLVPFECSCSPFILQRQIPIHLLPKKLYVHDPWRLVDTANTYHTDPESLNEQRRESWNSKTDRVCMYTLSIPPELVEAASKAAITAEAEASKLSETIFISPQEIEGPTEQPAMRVFLPPRPPKLTEVPEGHLYLSPKGRLGEGNHSIVYEVELELPRELFCESTYCRTCLDDQIKVEVNRLKESGEWDRMVNDVAKEIVVIKAQDATSNDTLPPSSVQIPPRYVGFVKEKFEHLPMETMSILSADHVAAKDHADAPAEQLVRVSDPVINRYIQYEGPVISVHPNIRWQNPSFPDTICEHQTKKKPVPRTATFRVAAKLSLPDDGHLDREASNYLAFPAHFFQHWSGYNVVPPLHDPTPVGALVPQSFGYYKPDAPDSERNAFWSPILLVEHCGKPISVDTLSLDDRHECAALLYRFHAGGWTHNSFAARNILRQKRHPTCSPLEDGDKCERVAHRHRPYSFRMIDFGRSTRVTSGECIIESMDARKLFRIMEFAHL